MPPSSGRPGPEALLVNKSRSVPSFGSRICRAFDKVEWPACLSHRQSTVWKRYFNSCRIEGPFESAAVFTADKILLQWPGFEARLDDHCGIRESVNSENFDGLDHGSAVRRLIAH